MTLTGVGGVGKTRLALQVAAEVVTDFPNGAWLCEFAPVADPDAVWETLAASLRVQAFPGRSLEESVLEYLAAKRLLLVLDNCEHLLDAIARQVTAITQRCARVSVLATSREGLALAGERIVAVPSLGVPADDATSTRSWERMRCSCSRIGRAPRRTSSRSPTATRVRSACCAAGSTGSRWRSSSPRRGCGRCHPRISLPVSTSGSSSSRGAAAPRSSGIRPCGARSTGPTTCWNRRNGARSTGCRSSPAAVIWPQPKPCWPATTSTSWMWSTCWASSSTSRWSSPTTTATVGCATGCSRASASTPQERLEADGDTAAVRRRHADYYVELAETAGPHLRSRDQLEWIKVVAPEIDNFRAAFDWAVETPSADHAFRLIAPFTLTLAIGDAARDWAVTASTIPGGDDHPLFPVVAAWAASDGTFSGDFERAEARIVAAERAQQALGVRLAAVANARAVLAFYRGDLEQVVPYAQEWAELARASGDDYELALALMLLASCAHARTRRRDCDARGIRARCPRRGDLLRALDRPPLPRRDAPDRGVRTRARPPRRGHRGR